MFVKRVLVSLLISLVIVAVLIGIFGFEISSFAVFLATVLPMTSSLFIMERFHILYYPEIEKDGLGVSNFSGAGLNLDEKDQFVNTFKTARSRETGETAGALGVVYNFAEDPIVKEVQNFDHEACKKLRPLTQELFDETIEKIRKGELSNKFWTKKKFVKAYRLVKDDIWGRINESEIKL